MENKDNTPLEKLFFSRELRRLSESWKYTLERMKKELADHKKNIDDAEIYIQEVETNRPKIFAQFLEDREMVIKGLIQFNLQLLNNEREQIVKLYNKDIISAMVQTSPVYTLKDYIRRMKDMFDDADYTDIVDIIIEYGSLFYASEFIADCSGFPDKEFDRLHDYIESLKVADKLTKAK